MMFSWFKKKVKFSNETLTQEISIEKDIELEEEIKEIISPKKVELSKEEIEYFKTYELKKADGSIKFFDNSFEIILLNDGYNIISKIKNQLQYSVDFNKPFVFSLDLRENALYPGKERIIRDKLKKCGLITSTIFNKEDLFNAISDFENFVYKYEVIFKNDFLSSIQSDLEIIRSAQLAKEKLESIQKESSIQINQKRLSISQSVKDAVWNRDGGKCVECGSNEKLEFDHIIPYSKGGADTYRNIQLLCEKCNRSKSNKIG